MTHVEAPQTLSNARVHALPDQMSANLAGEVVVLDLSCGIYFGLGGVASRVWELLKQPRTVEDLEHAILEEYDVEPTRCREDLLALLTELEKSGLVELECISPFEAKVPDGPRFGSSSENPHASTEP